ncbi:unnamed protein product [Allacma fusca]|uniref:Uncharacterized protein n=1 Tax=Allacma fusca TaxID=39272 RepID=A0A8J2KQM3_9HEXA|nr:unnamed protein product [Allacma fusca]
MKNRNPYKASILFAGPAFTVVAAALLGFCLLLFYVVIPAVIKALIIKETRLINGTDTWNKWTDVKVPILIKFYFFNVTNIEEADRGGKFQVREVGPYVWEEKRSKQIVAMDEEEDTVTYKEVVWYYFRPDLSIGSQEDTVNIVNIPFIVRFLQKY